MSRSVDLGALGVSDVSRETIDRLDTLIEMALKWNRRINLIGRGSEGAIWTRHVADSAQLWALRPSHFDHWADLGAGGGFPGLVLAAFAASQAPVARITLVESDARKCAFLAEASRRMHVQVLIENRRVEALDPMGADVVSARALAPLDQLLDFTQRHRSGHGMGLFPKGRTVHMEIERAEAHWRFEHRLHRSVTDPDAAIVEVGALSRA